MWRSLPEWGVERKKQSGVRTVRQLPRRQFSSWSVPPLVCPCSLKPRRLGGRWAAMAQLGGPFSCAVGLRAVLVSEFDRDRTCIGTICSPPLFTPHAACRYDRGSGGVGGGDVGRALSRERRRELPKNKRARRSIRRARLVDGLEIGRSELFLPSREECREANDQRPNRDAGGLGNHRRFARGRWIA